MKTLIYILTLLLFMNFPGCEKDDPNISGEIEGIVKDYTGLDGCGFIFELENGEKLEAAEIVDKDFTLYDNQRVALTYTELTGFGSICMVGKIARIETIREIGCIPYNQLATGDLPRDAFVVDSVVINGNCLDVAVHYSGGCKEHEFQLTELPTMGASPSGPIPVFIISHEANDDLCEAWIGDFVSFDLSEMQNQGSHSSMFILRLNIEGSDYSKIITYNY